MKFPTMAAFTMHTSFSDLSSKYDGFILDQFGVLHNGKQALPGAVECIEHLGKQNKKLVILSNSSASAKSTLDRLPRLGFSSEYFTGAVTSGEEASRYIAQTYGSSLSMSMPSPSNIVVPKRVIWLTWDGASNPTSMAGFLSQCGNIEIADSVQEADFVLAHGAQVWKRNNKEDISLGSFMTHGQFDIIDPILNECIEHNLPMVCANPDFVAQIADGSTAHMPGKIAKRYTEKGGACTSFGKPNKEHFEACLEELGLPRDRVAHVGDSLHHDIAGANAAGITSIFVTGGIHTDDIDSSPAGYPTRDSLETLFRREGDTIPTHVVPMFRL